MRAAVATAMFLAAWLFLALGWLLIREAVFMRLRAPEHAIMLLAGLVLAGVGAVALGVAVAAAVGLDVGFLFG